MGLDPLLFPVVEKVMVLDFLVVEQINEQDILRHERAVYERIGEVVNGHRVVVKSKFSVDVEFTIFDSLRIPFLFSEHPAIEMTIIKIAASKLSSRIVLLNFVTLYVTDAFAIVIHSATNRLIEGHLGGFERVLVDSVQAVALLGDGKC